MAGTRTDQDMRGKICLVTGATSGIGLVTAQALAARGAEVILHGRSREKAEQTLQMLQAKTGNERLHYLLADFADLQQVQAMTQSFTEQFRNLDVLVNNAGGFFLFRQVTSIGVEQTMQVNHLAPFLLTNLLLDALLASPSARIVNVSSGSHRHGRLDFDDPGFKKDILGIKPYERSKLANVLFTYELARRLQGSQVTVNAVHPGLVATNIWRSSVPPLLGPIVRWSLARRALTPDQGADTLIYLAASPEVAGVTGSYFVHRKAVQSSPESYNEDLARRLWQVSEELTGLKRSPVLN